MIDDLITNLLNGESLVEEAVRRLGRKHTNLPDKDIHKYMKRNMRRGDVLIVGPVREKRPLALRAFYRANRALFGKNSSHVDMYVGRDKVITADNRGVITKGIGPTVKNRDHITVVRPHKMHVKGRNKTVKFAKNQLGKSFGIRNLIGAGLKRVHPRLSLGPLSSAKNAFICSGLLAHSLEQGGVKVHDRKASEFVAPADFRRSKGLKKVMSFDRDEKTNKWAITQRLRRARRKKRKR
ncbi:MAG: hypothetical protein ACXABY_18090 [Candidatus Thorarchaeota archaeon]|jgi:hypothetical protein